MSALLTASPDTPTRTDAASRPVADGSAGHRSEITASAPRSPLAGLSRELGRAEGDHPGPTLVCIGGLHGNEPAGVLALRRTFAALVGREARLHGRLVGLVGNRKALSVGQRFLDDDFNRIWSDERVDRVRTSGGGPLAEDEELYELDQALQAHLNDGESPAVVVDLHTTSGPGASFAIFDDTLENRDFALRWPVTLVLGLEEELSGTLSHYLTDRGITNVTFEAGQHDEPSSVDRAEAAVWLALHNAGLLEDGDWPEVDAAQRFLTAASRDLPHVVEVRYRHAITAEDAFLMAPGYATFQQVSKGEPLARDRSGEVRSPEGGLLLMPLYQVQGEDGFFVTRPVHPAWLRLSAILRRKHLERWLHWLPGVRRHAERPRSFIVDRRYARWLALELFHLLGFRREGPPDRFLTMTRRSHE